MENSDHDEIDENLKLKKYLKIKLYECEIIITKYKSKCKKIKYIYYSLVITSIICGSVACVASALSAMPTFIVPIVAGISTFTTTLSIALKLADKKDKLNAKINELNKIRNYIQYVEALNGDLTQEKINEILDNV